MADSEAQIYCRPKPMEPTTLSLGDVLASARSLYGNPWLSILRVPRRSVGLFVYLTPDESGLTYSVHAFTAGRSEHNGGHIGEPTLSAGVRFHRGVTAEYWSAFTQDSCPTPGPVLAGEVSAMEGYIR